MCKTLKDVFTERINRHLGVALHSVRGISIDIFKDLIRENKIADVDYKKVDFAVSNMVQITLLGDTEIGRCKQYSLVPGTEIFPTEYVEQLLSQECINA
jgi:hypothetical protein